MNKTIEMTNEYVEEVFNQYKGLAVNIASKLTIKHVFEYKDFLFDDVKSVAYFGLYKAITTFDEEKGFRFTTYATKCITNEVLTLFNNKLKYVNKDTTVSMDQEKIVVKRKIMKDEEDECIRIGNNDDYGFMKNELLSFIKSKGEVYYEIAILLYQGYSGGDIGKTLSMSRQNVNIKVKRLREWIKKEYMRGCEY